MDNLKSNKMVAGNIPNYLYFSCVLWFLWKWRCKKVFDTSFHTPPTPHLIINDFAKSWLDANFATIGRDSIPLQIVWMAPTDNWVKLNIDGSCDIDSGRITTGGVLRNHQKKWLRGGFVLNMGISGILEAELWGILEGLRMSWNSGF